MMQMSGTGLHRPPLESATLRGDPAGPRSQTLAAADSAGGPLGAATADSAAAAIGATPPYDAAAGRGVGGASLLAFSLAHRPHSPLDLHTHGERSASPSPALSLLAHATPPSSPAAGGEEALELSGGVGGGGGAMAAAYSESQTSPRLRAASGARLAIVSPELSRLSALSPMISINSASDGAGGGGGGPTSRLTSLSERLSDDSFTDSGARGHGARSSAWGNPGDESQLDSVGGGGGRPRGSGSGAGASSSRSSGVAISALGRPAAPVPWAPHVAAVAEAGARGLGLAAAGSRGAQLRPRRGSPLSDGGGARPRSTRTAAARGRARSNESESGGATSGDGSPASEHGYRGRHTLL